MIRDNAWVTFGLDGHISPADSWCDFGKYFMSQRWFFATEAHESETLVPEMVKKLSQPISVFENTMNVLRRLIEAEGVRGRGVRESYGQQLE